MLGLAAIIVPHAVAQVRAQHGGGPASLVQPGREADSIERQQVRIVRAVGDGDREGGASVRTNTGGEFGHRLVEGREVGAVPGAKAAPGMQPRLRSPTPQTPFREMCADRSEEGLVVQEWARKCTYRCSKLHN